jgi:shikimate dehydrogenase
MRCAVLGDPIDHSLSPVLHRAAYGATGLAWEYDAHRVPAGGLAGFVAGLDATWRGLSLTMPLKREALALPGVVEVGPWARAAGAANTLVRGDGGWSADNTDVPGAVAAVRERSGGPFVTATVLGGGATAASTALALCELGVGSITLLVRSPARAAETLEAIDRHPARPGVRIGSLAADDVVGDLVVSTIPSDAQDDALLARCREVPVVFDVLYDPWPTPLARQALAGGQVLVGGLDLLVHQAALQFTAFAGLDAPLAAMRAAGDAALQGRA